MSQPKVPESTVYRLSLYHCYLNELVRLGRTGEITSRVLAESLGLKEETVRRDMSFVGSLGRPGAGYDPALVLDRLTEFLGLSAEYPIVMVGTADMLHALELVFPADLYGFKTAACFSELHEDAGRRIGDVEVAHLSDIPRLDQSLGIEIALVATSPGWAQVAVDLLAQAKVTGVLLMTPIITLHAPEGMNIRKLRLPCDLKTLACHCRVPIPGMVEE